MFGYIRISKPELKVKEYDMYKAVYCSLCRTLGKKYGFLTRFTLSYDFTFLALLELALSKDFITVERKRCVCNPLKKCNYCKEATLSFSAAAAIIMLYYKLSDDIQDEAFFKRSTSWFLRLIFSSAHKKAAAEFSSVEEVVKEYITVQKQVEKDSNASLDCAAEPTSVVLGKIFSMCSCDQMQKRVLERLGSLLGRYIYIIDAALDVEDDAKKGAFNPLGKINKQTAAERVVPQINIIISEAINAFELLEINRFKDILGNIIYVGIEDTVKKELKI